MVLSALFPRIMEDLHPPPPHPLLIPYSPPSSPPSPSSPLNVDAFLSLPPSMYFA